MPSKLLVFGYIFAMILVATIWNQSQDILIRLLSLFFGAAFFASCGAKDVSKTKKLKIGVGSLVILVGCMVFVSMVDA
ncbi:hypothetical protein D0C16_13025 [Cellvibrio sp. KY-GH-1]|uniref:hypothetical protein n=1 Tax=Cellvibrio sp. KY-GH-1 TaxID=2303332 RepID=UPI001243E659|nr:hypothetical protein [Cellvibrio sp. KY-GH-1]QEY16811.1 hypothetical protein D0C16_13025 [Cellvibrio sp. KY-GH-1]